MSEKKLLSCPFCGGEAELCSTGNPYDVNYHWIYCKECGCKQPTSIHIEAVINAWNTRKPMEKTVEKLEMLAERHMALSENAGEKGFEKHMILEGGKGMAFELAIEIVKKEGGLNDSRKM